jgi:hypothetical protein
MSIDDATDGDTFAAYLEQVLLPVLRQRKPDAGRGSNQGHRRGGVDAAGASGTVTFSVVRRDGSTRWCGGDVAGKRP